MLRCQMPSGSTSVCFRSISPARCGQRRLSDISALFTQFAMPLWYGGEEIVDQSGRNVIVTGGTSGLGLSTAKALTSRGAQVIITGRSPGKGDRCVTASLSSRRLLQLIVRPSHRAVSEVRAFTKNGHIEFIRCDVSDLRLVFFLDMASLRLVRGCIPTLCLHAGPSKNLQITTSNQARSCIVSSTMLAQHCLHTISPKMVLRWD